MPQPLQSRVDCHQGGHNLHPVMTGTTGIHFPGDLVQVVTHTCKLAQQRRGYRWQSAGTRRLLIEAGLTHPRRQLPAVAPLEQPPVFVFRHPHREHLVAFVCQSNLLITPGRAGNFPGRHGVGQAAGASVAFSGFRGAALNQSRSASGVYTGLKCNIAETSDIAAT